MSSFLYFPPFLFVFKVSRTFGDIESKIPELGGVPGVVSPEPEIMTLPFSEDLDYAFLACDGVFDVLTNEEVNDVIWETIDYYKEKLNDGSNDLFGLCLNDCVNNVLKKSMLQNSEDNITVIFIAFKNFLKS